MTNRNSLYAARRVVSIHIPDPGEDGPDELHFPPLRLLFPMATHAIAPNCLHTGDATLAPGERAMPDRSSRLFHMLPPIVVDPRVWIIYPTRVWRESYVQFDLGIPSVNYS